MPIFDFECRKCKANFEIHGINNQEADNVFCLDCKSRDLEIVGYDKSANRALYRLAKAIAELDKKVDAVIAVIAEEVETQGDS